MKCLAVINEPPFHPRSWSGTAPFLFGSLRRNGSLATALDVRMSPLEDLLFRLRNVRAPLAAWKEAYHIDTRFFERQTEIVRAKIAKFDQSFDAVLQACAYYRVSDTTDRPCFTYQDGTIATRIAAGNIALPAGSREMRACLEWERDLYRDLRGIFTFSSWLASTFARDFNVPHSKIVVVGCGLNLDPLPSIIKNRNTAPRFLMVGRDFERKGGAVLLDAFTRVRRKRRDATLVLIGPELRNLPDGVECLGFLRRERPADVAKLEEEYRKASVYVLPSLYEPFGISLLEAMAHGLPCIGVSDFAMPEIVVEGATGRLVERGNADSLAVAMLELVGEPEMATAFGLAGRKRLEERFTWDAVARRMVDAMKSMS
ncbi:MAG: glycosyltransferase family 4 protein [Steroidobacteraceae bacterium]